MYVLFTGRDGAVASFLLSTQAKEIGLIYPQLEGKLVAIDSGNLEEFTLYSQGGLLKLSGFNFESEVDVGRCWRDQISLFFASSFTFSPRLGPTRHSDP